MGIGQELTIYTKFSGDISKIFQKTTPLSEIRPENRIVVEGGMYVASCAILKLVPSGLLGILNLTFYKEITDKEEKVKNLAIMVINKIFRKNPNKPDIEYGDKKFRKEWCSSSNDRAEWLISYGRVDRHIIGKMKVELIKDWDLLFSDNFLSSLFLPVLGSLLDVHSALANF